MNINENGQLCEGLNMPLEDESYTQAKRTVELLKDIEHDDPRCDEYNAAIDFIEDYENENY